MSILSPILASALAHHQAGRLQEAENLYRQFLALSPEKSHALMVLNNLGLALHEQGRLTDAVSCFQQVLQTEPRYAEAHKNLGNVFKQQERASEAIACYRRALELEPDNADVYNNLGIVLDDQGELSEATECYRRAVRIRPDFAQALNNLGLVLHHQGELIDAAQSLEQALRLQPDFVDAKNSLANVLRAQGRLDEALALYEKALRLSPHNPMVRWNRALLWLLQGDLEKGWPDFELRQYLAGHAHHDFSAPRWDGSSLRNKTILLYSEQGLGDTLQFVRYVQMIKDHGATILLACQPALVNLLKKLPSIDQVITTALPFSRIDFQAPLMSLPGIFKTRLSTIPAEVPYLRADSTLIESWKKELNEIKGLKVGIAWQGNPKAKSDFLRSVPLASFAPLAKIEGVRLISLQIGASPGRLTGGSFPVTDVGCHFHSDSMEDVAAALMNLDLVISVDTAIAHLAGGLAIPIWVLVPFSPDWRWLLARQDSPWYPTMRLFRQKEPKTWDEVFVRVAAALEQIVTTGTRITPRDTN